MGKNESHKGHGIAILLLAILLVFGLLISLNDVNAANYTVDTNANLGHTIGITNSGSGGDNIIINGGTYSSANGNNVTNLDISKNVNIYGAKYLGRSDQDTILDGGNKDRFFNIASGVTVNIYGIKFQNTLSPTDGGAISSVGGTCNLKDVSFINCHAQGLIGGSGGAISAVNSSGWSFANVDFINCSAGFLASGGAINAVNSNNWSFVNSNFINCSSMVNGGGVSVVNSSGWSFEKVSFINCTGTLGGDAAHFVNGGFNFVFCEFINNRATGGVIYSLSSNGIISYSLFLNNKDNNSNIYQIRHNGTGTVIANNNYWGNNFPLYQVLGVTINSWYVIIFNNTSSNIIGDKLKFSYNLFLYDGKNFVHDSNVSRLPYFQVTLKHDGVVIGVLDGRKSYSNIWSTIVKSTNKLDVYYGNFLLTNTSFRGLLKTKIVASKAKFTGRFGKNITLKATLTDVNGKKLSGKYVGLFVNGKIVGLEKTNSKGIATFKHRIALTGNLKVSFLHIGDGNYTNATVNSKLAVKKHSMLLINNTLKKSGRSAKVVSIISNYGPDKLNAKITYRLAKGVKAVKISKKLGKVSYNKKKRIVTFNLSKFAKSTKKLARLVITFNKPLSNRKYFTNKVTSKNTLDVYNTMK